MCVVDLAQSVILIGRLLGSDNSIEVRDSDLAMETAYEALRRIVSGEETSYNLDANLFPDGGLASGELVEISGDSNSGKSLLLLELIARIILPTNCGGLERGAVLIDCESSYNRTVLLSIMEKNILNQAEPTTLAGTLADPEQMETIKRDALQRFHVVTCYSLEQFEFSMLSLPALFIKHTGIKFLLIDSIATFYWTKCTANNLIRQDTFQRAHCKTLRRLAQKWRKVVLYTKPGHFGGSGWWRDFESTAPSAGMLQDGSSTLTSSFSGNLASGRGNVSSSTSSLASGNTVDHRIELCELDSPSPRGCSGSGGTHEQRFNAFITTGHKQYVRFYMIDKYGFNWIER